MDKLNNFDIGKHVAEVLRQSGMTASELARRIGTSRSNMASLLDRSDLYTKQLYQIGVALGHDFFNDLRRHTRLDELLDPGLPVDQRQKMLLSAAEQRVEILEQRVQDLTLIVQLKDELLRQCRGELAAVGSETRGGGG